MVCCSGAGTGTSSNLFATRTRTNCDAANSVGLLASGTTNSRDLTDGEVDVVANPMSGRTGCCGTFSPSRDLDLWGPVMTFECDLQRLVQ
jgi:hypothetical protein